jgi:hypothetical protein
MIATSDWLANLFCSLSLIIMVDRIAFQCTDNTQYEAFIIMTKTEVLEVMSQQSLSELGLTYQQFGTRDWCQRM